jgi:hypothetical protein
LRILKKVCSIFVLNRIIYTPKENGVNDGACEEERRKEKGRRVVAVVVVEDGSF